MRLAQCMSVMGVAAVLFLGNRAYSATSLYVANYSFEDPPNSPGNASNDAATNYTVFTGDNSVDGSGSYTGAFYPTSGNVSSVPDGDQVLFTEFGSADNTPAGVSQSLVASSIDSTPVTAAAGETYTLLIDVGKRFQNNADADYSVFFTLSGLEIGTPLTGDDATITNGTFVDDLAATYTAPANVLPGQQLGFTIEQTSGADGSAQILFDDVRINAQSAPEPGSFALFAIAGTLGMGRRRKIVQG